MGPLVTPLHSPASVSASVNGPLLKTGWGRAEPGPLPLPRSARALREAAPPRGSGSGLWPRSVPPRPWGSCSCIFEMARFRLGVRVIGLSDSETSLFPRRMELCFWLQGRKAPQNLGSFCAFHRAQKDTRLERLCGQLGPQHHLPQASWGAEWPCSPSEGPRLEKRAVATQGSVFRSKGRTGGAGARPPSPRAPRP